MKNVSYGVELEFTLEDENGFTFANNYISDPNRSKHIGLDGNSSTGEIRSDIKTSIHDAVSSATLYLYQFYSEHQNLLIDFTKYKPVGLHIHFGVKSKFLSKSDLDKFKKIMLKALKGLLPFYFKWNGKKRLDSNYALLTDTEDKSWGFEYRLIPSGFILDKFAYDVFTTIQKHVEFLLPNMILGETLLNKIVSLNNINLCLKLLNYYEEEYHKYDYIADMNLKDYSKVEYTDDIPLFRDIDNLITLNDDRRIYYSCDNSKYKVLSEQPTFLQLYGGTMLFFPGTFVFYKSNLEQTGEDFYNELKEKGIGYFMDMYIRNLNSKSIRLNKEISEELSSFTASAGAVAV